MNNFQKIQGLLEKSSLTQEEKDSLFVLFSFATDEDLAEAIELFSENPAWLKKTAENFIKKRDVINSGDYNQWKSILDFERQELDQLAN